MRYFVLILLSVLLLAGCSKEAATTANNEVPSMGHADEMEKQRWQGEGWSYVETVGTPVDGAQSRPFLKSDTARSVTATAFDGVQHVKKVFPQSNYVYLLVNMGNSDKTYTLVFRRPRPAPPDAAPNGGPAVPVD